MPEPKGQVVYIDCLLRPEKGSFARTKKMVRGRHLIDYWFFCREVFHHLVHKQGIFFFSTKNGGHKSVAQFMEKIETMLDARPRSAFGPTQRKNIMWVEPSGWWMRFAMRRSLFTILLRAGNSYSKSSGIDGALASDRYLRDTEYAVRRFLAGHTRYKGRKRGWHKQFFCAGPSSDEVDLLLVRP